MEAYQQRVEEVAALMKEFGLSEVSLSGEGWCVSLRKGSRPAPQPLNSELPAEAEYAEEIPEAAPVPPGLPVTSPMNGIYYGAPSPSAPEFVKVGEAVTAGQVVCLIEAMKVFNEIMAPTSGIVTAIVAQTGQLVEPGETLLTIR